MKTAYELAMERLEKSAGATKKLTEEHRERIAEIENKNEANIAETKLNIGERVSKAANMDELQALKAEMAKAVSSLQEKCDSEKNAVWEEA